jgi:hypothetical protein
VHDRPDIEVTGVSDEHGKLKVGPHARPLSLGEKVWLIPGHSDPTVNPGVRPHTHARGSGELGHLCNIAVKSVEIDNQCRGLDLGDGYTNLGGRRVTRVGRGTCDD